MVKNEWKRTMSSEPTIDDLLDLSPAPAPNLTGFPDYLESGELGALLGLSRVRLNTLGKSGVIPCKMVAGINRFPIPDAVIAYVEYAKANPSGRRVADPDLADQKKRLAKEQADKIEQELIRKGILMEEDAEMYERDDAPCIHFLDAQTCPMGCFE